MCRAYMHAYRRNRADLLVSFALLFSCCSLSFFLFLGPSTSSSFAFANMTALEDIRGSCAPRRSRAEPSVTRQPRNCGSPFMPRSGEELRKRTETSRGPEGSRRRRAVFLVAIATGW